MVCHVCGNEYDKCFEVLLSGTRYAFDCFECAIHALAPSCAHCQCRIIGHGIETESGFYCCAHCARGSSGETEVKDRTEGSQSRSVA